ncbi:hypothetical protein [Lacimicrobium sp. SS2-24]|uniref:hypothetical protein n=1 Tax=Lacimicrobium sp. SS2-24 TaxID=2005569 RepID=UPI000B4AA8EF|nr:hypothetical protein [Lacimicrobium sp. SS2-24]
MLNKLQLPVYKKIAWFITLLGLFLVFQIIGYLSANIVHQRHIQQSILAVEQRIALDLPWLQLPNEAMKSVADKAAIRAYLQRLNEQAQAQQLPITVTALQGIDAEADKAFGYFVEKQLNAPAQTFRLTLMAQPYRLSQSFSPLALMAALIMTLALYQYQTAKARARQEQSRPEEGVHEAPKLVIDLHNRTFRHNLSGKQVQLSNKPFCFYIALVDYCLNTEAPALNHNKNIPEALLELANRYFYRMIELGHTIRKRPDFSSNLDKMLSEIRAALDEVFAEAPEQKIPFYPPKAQGEGSRSKLHNYALEQLQPEDLEFIGK